MVERDPRTYAVIGAAMEVHRVLGYGFTEPVYQKALAVELEMRSIPFHPQFPVTVNYKGIDLDATYRVDFICYDELIVELKALSVLSGSEEAQIINYLKATKYHVGLLITLGKPSLEFHRFVLS